MKGNLEVYIEDGKMKKEFQRNDGHAWMDDGRDLTMTCVWFDFGSVVFLALIALLMVGNVSVIYWQSHRGDLFC